MRPSPRRSERADARRPARPCARPTTSASTPTHAAEGRRRCALRQRRERAPRRTPTATRPRCALHHDESEHPTHANHLALQVRSSPRRARAPRRTPATDDVGAPFGNVEREHPDAHQPPRAPGALVTTTSASTLTHAGDGRRRCALRQRRARAHLRTPTTSLQVRSSPRRERAPRRGPAADWPVVRAASSAAISRCRFGGNGARTLHCGSPRSTPARRRAPCAAWRRARWPSRCTSPARRRPYPESRRRSRRSSG